MFIRGPVQESAYCNVCTRSNGKYQIGIAPYLSTDGDHEQAPADNEKDSGDQVIGRRYDEPTVLTIAATLESIQPWAESRPPV